MCSFIISDTDSKPPKEEQRVFVWNNFSVDKAEDNDDMADDDSRCRSPASESSLVGFEIAPGIGSVLPNNNEDNTESYKTNTANIDINSTEGVAKKVCHLSFDIFHYLSFRRLSVMTWKDVICAAV